MADLQSESKERTQVKRVPLHNVMIDTPALLNMVKHCREADVKTGGKGSIMGVLRNSEADGHELLIT